jgi:folate-binding protein YgfZ
MIPETASALSESYDAVRHHSGLVPRDDDARIVVSGKDRASYLHGLLTNDITSLGPGQGCYAAYLTPQGRMIADMRVYELGDVILLVVGRDVKDALLARLDQFIFTEDVQLGDVTETYGSVAVVGPEAATVVSTTLGLAADTVRALREHGNMRTQFNGRPAILLHVSDLGEPGYDVLVEASALSAFREAARLAGARDVDEATAEAIRIEGGIPRFHRDMDEETIPLEAGIESRAISLTKGCYVGQEVIVRVLHRGHGRVARKLVGLSLVEEAVPEAGAKVRNNDRDIGEVTSATWSPLLRRPIALAFVHRDFTTPGTVVAVNGAPAEVSALPFVKQE